MDQRLQVHGHLFQYFGGTCVCASFFCRSGGLFTFFDDQIFYFARLGICSRSFNPDARDTGYTVFAARVKQIFQRIHGGRNVIASPISTTLASCLKNAASVYTSTLKNKPEIVMLLSFIRFDFHERPHFGLIYINTLLIQLSSL